MTVGITELPPEGMQLGGVALAGDTERGTRTTDGLSLLFTTSGITVQGPQPQIERLLVWSGLDSATCHEKIDLPDGRSAAIMELTSGGQSIRFLLPTPAVSPGQVAYLDQALPAWLARYKGAPQPAAAAPSVAPVERAPEPDVSEEATADSEPMLATAGVGAAARTTAGTGSSTPWDSLSEDARMAGDDPMPRRHRLPFARRKAATAAVGATMITAGTVVDEPAVEQATSAPPRTEPASSGASAPASGAALASTGPAVTGMPPTAPPIDAKPLGIQPPPAVTGPPAGDSGGAPETVAATGDGAAAAPKTATDASPAIEGQGSGVVLADSAPRSRIGLVVAGVAVAGTLVAAGVALFAGSSDSTSPPPANPASTRSDALVAQTVNLHLSDLPPGWSTTTPVGTAVRPPVAPAAAQSAADATMGTCLGTDAATVSGLFGPGQLPGATAEATSPTFQSTAGPSFEMSAWTSTMASAGQAQALGSALSSANFLPCLTQYENAVAASAVPGATVLTQPVTLPAPSGTQSFGVVSTYTLPGTGTEVVGQAFILGGRVLTKITPSTAGQSIPSDVFGAAYKKVADRVAAAATR